MAKSLKKKALVSSASKPAAKPSAAKLAKPKPAKPKLTKPGKKIPKAVSRHIARTATLPSDPSVIDRLWSVVLSRRDGDPATSHSARLLSRGVTKVALACRRRGLTELVVVILSSVRCADRRGPRARC